MAITAAITMAESARLNVGQYLMEIQSVTSPFVTRSVKFPSAPPSTRPKVIAQGFDVIRGDQYAITAEVTIAKIVKTIELIRSEKAAPELVESCSLRKSPINLIGSTRFRSAQNLVRKAVNQIDHAIRNSGRALI